MIQNDVLGNARLEGIGRKANLKSHAEDDAEGHAEEKNNIARKMLANGWTVRADCFNYWFDRAGN